MGYTISGSALSFVANFNGIILQYPQTFPEATGRFDTCILDAARATGAIFESTVRSYEDRIRDALCPVGVAASGHLILLASSSGRMFGGYDSFLALYGDNGYMRRCVEYSTEPRDRQSHRSEPFRSRRAMLMERRARALRDQGSELQSLAELQRACSEG